MKISPARIGRVRFKSGGELRPLKTRPERATEEIKATAKRHVGMMAQFPQVDGYVIVWWDRRGDYRCGWRFSNDSVITPTLAPSFVRDALLRERIEGSLQEVTGRRADQGDA